MLKALFIPGMSQDTMPAVASDSPEPAPSAVPGRDAHAALERAVDYLRSLQDPAGWWIKHVIKYMRA